MTRVKPIHYWALLKVLRYLEVYIYNYLNYVTRRFHSGWFTRAIYRAFAGHLG